MFDSDTSPEFEAPKPTFGVTIENPEGIYQKIYRGTLENGGFKNITHLMKSFDRRDVEWDLSSTTLSTTQPFVESEETKAKIEVEDFGPFCVFSSCIKLDTQTAPDGRYGFYGLEEIAQLGVGLRQNLNRTDVDIQSIEDTHGKLVVTRDKSVFVVADLGPISREIEIWERRNKMKRLEKMISLLENHGGPPNFVRREQLALADQQIKEGVNESISISLDNVWKQHGGVGTKVKSFRNYETFGTNLQFYGEVYEAIMKTLFQQKGIELPNKTITISPSNTFLSI